MSADAGGAALRGRDQTAGTEACATGSGWTCPVCFFYCQRDWLVCPVCDYIRPADLPMDDEVSIGSGGGFCVVNAARGLNAQ